MRVVDKKSEAYAVIKTKAPYGAEDHIKVATRKRAQDIATDLNKRTDPADTRFLVRKLTDDTVDKYDLDRYHMKPKDDNEDESLILEGRDAPLYHATSFDYLIQILKSDTLKTGRLYGRDVAAGRDHGVISLTRSIKFAQSYLDVVLTIDQSKLVSNYKLIPLGDNANSANRDRLGARRSRPNANKAEETVDRDITNLHKYLIRIDIDMLDGEVEGYLHLLREYSTKNNVPIYVRGKEVSQMKVTESKKIKESDEMTDTVDGVLDELKDALDESGTREENIFLQMRDDASHLHSMYVNIDKPNQVEVSIRKSTMLDELDRIIEYANKAKDLVRKIPDND